MEKKDFKLEFPNSEKTYINGKLYPDIKVAMRKVKLTPTVTEENGVRTVVENDPIYVYDTSGPFSDPQVDVDCRKGLPSLRGAWVEGKPSSLYEL